MTKEQATFFIYYYLNNERLKGAEIRKIDEKIQYQRMRLGAKSVTYDTPRVQGGEAKDIFLDSTNEILELEKEKERYTSLSPMFLKIIECLDPLEYSVVFGYYANCKTFSDIIKSYIKSSMPVPHINTLKKIKKRAITKMISHVLECTEMYQVSCYYDIVE